MTDAYAEPVLMWDHSWQTPVVEADIVPLATVPTLEQIQALEAHLRQYPQMELEPVHYFADGLYGRELTIPAGTVLTGKIHKGRHLNFLIQGDITVWTEQGMKRLQAPQVFVSLPGTKRVGYAHADTRWVCVHGTHETDLVKLEAELIEPEFPCIESTAALSGPENLP